MSPPPYFFSLIIPAHNEEHYLANTLKHLLAQNYPPDRFEVIVVENGSNDQTYEVAKALAQTNLTVLTSPVASVSAAKNLGRQKIGPHSQWIVFLDADTILQPDFLADLNIYLQNHVTKNFVVGTTTILPLSVSLTAKFWFAFYDLGHRLTKTSYALQIIRQDVLDQINFDESLRMGEDLKLINQARGYGQFFFWPTTLVATSTRRFVKEGWLKVFTHWTLVALLPHPIKRRFGYKVIR